jgi:N-acetylglucosamine-6-phosphate deacetylase
MEHTAGALRMMTIAPEPAGSHQIIQRLVKRGIIASMGHTTASYEETKAGFDAGISHVTHLFNAMPSMHHRLPGPLPAIIENPGITAQIIADGVHLHPAVLKFAFDILGQSRCLTITDGMRSTGLGDGIYDYDGIEYESKNGTSRYHDNTLTGTTLGQNQILQRLMKMTGCDLVSAIRTASANPAKILGLENSKGSIAAGLDADIVILDDECNVMATIVGGRIVYQKAALM